MQVSRLIVNNFRGISHADILLPKHTVLIGDNNVGKTTILEAINLVLGPDRLNRFPPIDEHDFFRGMYITKIVCEEKGEGDDSQDFEEDGEGPKCSVEATESIQIVIEVTITDLNEEQKARFGDYLEFWNSEGNELYIDPDPGGVDGELISEALRVSFIGSYDPEEDDFEGKTFFTRSLTESDKPQLFKKKDKQKCGFLYLRSRRTGSRALSLERGSLLDIILRLKELRPQLWEATLNDLFSCPVACDPALGISTVLESINAALAKYVPKEWGAAPQLKVSNMTREHLRKVITAFIATGKDDHVAPFYRQGTGTINILVLAMLSQIAQDKQNVIFAMEEPETAIPPYAQKQIVHEVQKLSSQTIFTSHSPYVLEEFSPKATVVLSGDNHGQLYQLSINLPESVKPKRYRQEFRTRFCEGLLARRILIAEGATEAASVPAVSRRLSELNPGSYKPVEALGICTIDAGGENQIADLAKLYRGLGKQVFAICDHQSEEQKALIEAEVQELFMHDESGFEDLVLKNTTDEALKRYAGIIDWPEHIEIKYPDLEAQANEALTDYFKWTKAQWGVADFLAQCDEGEIPDWLRGMCNSLKEICEPPKKAPDVTEDPKIEAVEVESDG